MRIMPRLTILILLILVATVACTNNGQKGSRINTPDIEGPALVMFSTDN